MAGGTVVKEKEKGSGGWVEGRMRVQSVGSDAAAAQIEVRGRGGGLDAATARSVALDDHGRDRGRTVRREMGAR